ncbi:MAG: DUF885 domain-containing protein [Proteobacteria bacterium]|nr:DUF885 domain-containing protein [Pseudomonadota bacterium]
MTKIRAFLGFVAALLLAAAIFLVPTIWGKPWSIEHYYTRVIVEFALEHPMLLSYARILEPYGLDFHSDELEDVSDAMALHMVDQAEGFLEGLRAYDREEQSPEQRLSTDILAWFLQIQIDRRPFLFHGYPVQQMDGWQIVFPDFLVNIHQVHSERDARNYVARLRAIEPALEQVMDGLRARAERGVLPPSFILANVRASLADFVATPPGEHVLVTSLAEKLQQTELDDDSVERWLTEAEAVVAESVVPVYGRLEALLAEQEPRSSRDAGVWKLPEGDAYYRWALRYHTTTDLEPERVHALGLQEVDRIHAEMRAVLRELGDSIGDDDDPIPSLLALAAEPEYLYSEDDAGRDAILADYRAIVAEAAERLPELVDGIPGAAVTVERVPVFRQDGGAGAYYQGPAFDGSRPGTFYVNLKHVRETARWKMRTLAYHEAIPGHHHQIALAMEQQNVPFFRRVIPFTAFIEGWALYAETLADEAGWHPTPADRLGKLEAEIFRAARLVVDTGLHWKRWTRERAIDYMHATTGMPLTDVTREVERYIVMPGQACAYKVGQLEILRLRREARSALGERFDARGFNDLVVGGGGMPLVVLEDVVRSWIQQQSETT